MYEIQKDKYLTSRKGNEILTLHAITWLHLEQLIPLNVHS